MLPTIVLGMISPYSVRLMVTETAHSGRVAGTLYFVSTLGSALGTLATSFYLVLWFEIDTILLLLTGSLLALRRSRLRGGPRVVRLTLVLAAALLSASVHARVIHSETSLYQNILVTEDGTVRCMQFTVRKDQRNQSCVDQRAPKHLVFPYTRMMLAALLLDPAPTNVLVVGLGGGTLPTALSELYPNASIDVVEIDPAVVVVAKRYFDSNPPSTCTSSNRTRACGQSARRSDSKRYDLIMLDAFNGDYIPEHLMTRGVSVGDARAAHRRRCSRFEYVRDQPSLSQRVGHLCGRLRAVLQPAISRTAPIA